MSSTVVPASFRDPAGFVWSDGQAVYRYISGDYRERYELLMSSGLYEALVTEGLLVPHEEVSDVPSPRPGAYKILKPKVIRFVSYPYEWAFSQLKDAALTTLQIQRRAMDFGMSLHDASAYNIQFHEGRPLLIDTLSFEPFREGKPWIAYRQFCQHFLASLALMSHCDVRLGLLSRLYIDGVPLDLASGLLPRRTRMSPGLLAHIHTQVRLQRRRERSSTPAPVTKKGVSLQALKGIIWNLENTVHKLKWRVARTAWSDYYEEADHYSEAALAHKRELVSTFLDAAGGSTVWDLGGNVGEFSRLAAALGREVVCFDMDPGCVEVNYREIRSEGESRILPLLCDLRNPGPALGWANRERSSLAERGPADVVLALALVHHLAIANNVPLVMIAEYFAELASSLIIEFVPKSDPKVQLLLASRDDIFGAYNEKEFVAAFEPLFAIQRKQLIADTKRVLYLMKRKQIDTSSQTADDLSVR